MFGFLLFEAFFGWLSVIFAKSNDPLSVWAMKLRLSKPFNQVAVAVAHRLARLMWILLSRQEHYQAQTNTQVSV